VLFANGAAGDVSTRFTRLAQDITEVERVGSGLAQAAVTALASATAVFGPIRNERQTVNLPPRSLAEYVQTPKGQANQDQSAAEQRKQITRQQGAALLAKLVEVGPDAIPASFDLEAWSVGEIVLVAVPGELFASLGAQIARDSSTLVVGYANGYIGYLADEAAYAAETYEGLSSPFAPGAGELVVEAGRGLVNRIRTGEK
jgi:predicted dinucleotide-binding enzyme